VSALFASKLKVYPYFHSYVGAATTPTDSELALEKGFRFLSFIVDTLLDKLRRILQLAAPSPTTEIDRAVSAPKPGLENFMQCIKKRDAIVSIFQLPSFSF